MPAHAHNTYNTVQTRLSFLPKNSKPPAQKPSNITLHESGLQILQVGKRLERFLVIPPETPELVPVEQLVPNDWFKPPITVRHDLPVACRMNRGFIVNEISSSETGHTDFVDFASDFVDLASYTKQNEGDTMHWPRCVSMNLIEVSFDRIG
jgi:hypothetical protein